VSIPFNTKLRIEEIFVKDGDSIEATLTSGEREEIRLYGIDAPELDQPYGKAAHNHLIRMAGRRSGAIYVRDRDRYGRLVAVVYSGGDGNDGSVNLRMVRDGYAYDYPDYGKLSGAASAQSEASRKQRGMWASDDTLEKPWDYRQRSRSIARRADRKSASQSRRKKQQRYRARRRRQRRKSASQGSGCVLSIVQIAAVVTIAVAAIALVW